MKNSTLYLLTCLVALSFIISYINYKNSFTEVLYGMGCSGLAAGLMAIFLENVESKRKKGRIVELRQIYFQKLYLQLKMMIERLLWFNERLEDEKIDWYCEPHFYSSFKYMVASSHIVPERTVLFHEAENIMNKICEKYNMDNIKTINEEQREKVHKMFSIIAASSRYLIQEANVISANKFFLEIEKVIAIEELDSILFDISTTIGLMEKRDSNYELAVRSLINATKIIREIGNYTDEIRIGLHASFEISEI